MEVEEKIFATYTMILKYQWLKVEEKNNVRYVKSTGKRQQTKLIVLGKVKIKPDDERKGNAKNPNSEECLMKYFKCHYAHGHEIQHLRLSKSHWEGIASKLIMGVSERHKYFL